MVGLLKKRGIVYLWRYIIYLCGYTAGRWSVPVVSGWGCPCAGNGGKGSTCYYAKKHLASSTPGANRGVRGVNKRRGRGGVKKE